jgi:hypothetical protein
MTQTAPVSARAGLGESLTADFSCRQKLKPITLVPYNMSGKMSTVVSGDESEITTSPTFGKA